MAPEIPTGYTGVWVPGSAVGDFYRINPEFNRTVPTPQGRTSNHLMESPDELVVTAIAKPWVRDSPLLDVIHGCPRNLECKAQIKAPALTETACVNHITGVDYNLPATAN